ncbi:hypothetical protein BaRGS_00027784 [Batillaria attramentaria]|uniref:Poly(A) RNA polymerase, mitochondrial n=1 Tax=Batillaria attramentaria TaxID=370345 RepID=A0ABD0K1B7_9CAEN
MAASLGCVRRSHRTLIDITHVCSRHFASKGKRVQHRKKFDNPSIKSLFDDQPSRERTGQISSYKVAVDSRHDQAARSVLIRVQHALRAKASDHLLVEFEHHASVERLQQHVSFFPAPSQFPVCSRLLYAMRNSQMQRHRPSRSVKPEHVQTRDLLLNDYMTASTLSAQMEALHSVRRLSDVGSRLRYFVCSMVRDLVRTIFPHCRVDPFGSCSNGFGWEGCDLDMMLTMLPPDKHGDPNAKFHFLTKRGSEDERVFGKQCLDVVGEMIRTMMPSAYHVIKVLNARVPIIKFHHEVSGIDCDLSSVNVSGAKMSELMFLLGETDPRVRVLMTTVKQWARSCEVTQNAPGPWPSSFSLLAMLIFFLQTRSIPILPSIRSLHTPDDHFMIDGVDYAFVTDIRKVQRSSNRQTLEDLLHEFFHFYTHFDFATQGLSLIEGSAFTKHDPCPVYIENPVEVGHNIAKNISSEYIVKLQTAMLEALQCLESKNVPNDSEPWGLMCLFKPPLRSQTFSSLSVMGLFDEDADDVPSDERTEESDNELIREQTPARVEKDGHEPTAGSVAAEESRTAVDTSERSSPVKDTVSVS